ncbi:hypothetical protein LINGRAHAP2_LOCUS4709 [Linum grandiflorum]
MLWRQTQPSIIFLYETKNPEARLRKKLTKHLGLNKFTFVNPVGRSGGLVMAWADDLNGTCSFASDNCIKMDFSDSNGNAWSVFGVYLSTNLTTRKLQFDTLCTLCTHSSSPFTLCGDFNSILLHSEKESFSHHTSYASINAFNNFVSQLGLHDLQPTGPCFTWSNRQSAEVRCRLDRFLFSNSWLTSFPLGSAKNLSDLGSDHRAILYQAFPSSPGPRRYFVFDQRWNDSSDATTIIHDSWSDNILSGSNLFKLHRKLLVTRHNLAHWQAKGTTNSFRHITELKQEIHYSRSQNTVNWDSIRKLETDLETALRHEDLFWQRKARNKWITKGGRNTAYFHKIASFKTHKNYITSLYDNSGHLHYKEAANSH